MRLLVFHELSEIRQASFIRNVNGETEADLANAGYYVLGGVLHHIHGTPQNPTLFKTLKMANKARRDGYTWVKRDDPRNTRLPPGGKILVFDPALLPQVADDAELLEHPGLADKLTDAMFAERQGQLWLARAESLRPAQRVRCGVEGCRLDPNHSGLHAFGPYIP